MRTRTRKRIWIPLILIVLLGVIAVVILSGLLDPRYETSAVDEAPVVDDQMLARGKYLAQAGDCMACHTAKEGALFAGGVPIETPFGTIYGTNITPDKQHGIGNWTSADFYRALHDGIGAEYPLYPAMPYTTYRGMTREDSDALYAYLRSVEPVAVPNKPLEVPFPFNMRFLMRGWNLLFLKNELPDVSQGDSDQWLRGRYLTNALGHCTECHTPRGVFGQLNLRASFKGGELGALNSPDITPEGLARRGWTPEGLSRFLALGLSSQGSAYGDMYEAFHYSTRHLSEDDNQAMVTYVLGDEPLAAEPLPHTAPEPETAEGGLTTGRSIYMAVCAGCHAANGEGKPGDTVGLKGNSTVRNADAHNLIHVILHGLDAKVFPEGDRQAMPAFADKLSDQQIAQLANHLRTQWGGQKTDVQSGDVGALR
ncbi:cytochrome c [Pusillimonas sp.]|uniref:cytochrome c n=1 Tax=Pusillimonas sp. TaxID=3040095 RepID=UPI0037CC7CFD